MAAAAKECDVLVVGGGVVGLACAHSLLERGRAVRVVDRAAIGRGSSWANCGLVTPSHAVPLAVPGAMWKSLKMMADPRSPFYIKPTLDPASVAWFLRFAARCNRRDMVRSLVGRAALLNASREMFDALVAPAGPLDCEWEAAGLLMLYRTEKGFHAYDEADRMLEGFDIPCERLNGAETARREPAVRDDLYGSRFYAMDAHLRPDKLVTEWARVVAERGGEIEGECAVESIGDGANGAVEVRTSGGDLRAREVVLATGAWSRPIGRALGVRLPILPGKGYSVTMDRPDPCPRIPCLFKERNIAMTPWRSGYRLGGTMEFAGYDTTINRGRVDAILEGARHYMKTPHGPNAAEPWYGWRPMVYDGMPLIGRSPKHRRVWIAAGHSMLGVSMAPSTGRLLAELLCGEPTHVDPAPYDPARFA